MTAEHHLPSILTLSAQGGKRSRATRAGGKAAGLFALLDAALPVPEGFVILPDCDLRDARDCARVSAAARALGRRLIVRSSATIEDAAGAPFPGVFESIPEVPPEKVCAAAARVRDSLQGPAARLYAEALRVDAGGWEMAVLVQRQLDARVRGTVYTRPPGRADAADLVIEAAARTGFARARVARGAGWEIRACDPGFPLSRQQTIALARQSLAAEAAIGAADTGADVEWLWADDLWLVQARPIAHGPMAAGVDAAVLPANAKGRAWVWDASHNPDPLSPAQIGLVERVDAAAGGESKMLVVGGYLYLAADEAKPDETPPSADDLTAAWEELSATCERALLALSSPAPLTESIRAYETVALAHGAFSARAGAARRALVAFLAGLGKADPEAVAARIVAARADDDALTRAARAGDIAQLRELAAPLAAAWDVATPAFGENPEALERNARALIKRLARDREPRDAGELATLVAESPAARRVELWRLVDAAALAHRLAEEDDRFFFRAQAAVRRSLLALARRWQLGDKNDIFYLPLAEVLEREAQGRAPDPAEVATRAAAARAEVERQAQATPPMVIAATPLRGDRLTSSAHGLWRGRGTGGQARGYAKKLVDRGLDGDPDSGNAVIAVVQTVTPGLVLLASEARGLVSEHGGLLGHGAAMARQLGIPCVVECRGVFAALADGDLIAVDADAGLVARLRKA